MQSMFRMLHSISNMFVRYIRHISMPMALLAYAVLFTGCGGGATPVAPAINQPAAITVQPVSQVIPIGDTATFTVAATGTAPLTYQWSENGVPISGATSATYTTPTVALDSSGSNSIGSFDVTVSNAVGSVTSKSVTLNAGPRSPKAGDLRYLQWEQVAWPGGLGIEPNGVGDLGDTSESISNAVGLPLALGTSYVVSSSLCNWPLSYVGLPPPPTGLSVYYEEGFTQYESPTAYLQSVFSPNGVIYSIDLEPTCHAIGVSWIQTSQGGGFDPRIEIIPYGSNLAAAIQNQAAADGAQSRIVTAITLDTPTQQAILISYGWQGDTTTTYETQTYVAQPKDATSAGASLGNAGYAISAFGGNDTDGYALIGTRVQGDSMPRPFIGDTPNGYVSAVNPENANFTPTLRVYPPGDGGATGDIFWEQ